MPDKDDYLPPKPIPGEDIKLMHEKIVACKFEVEEALRNLPISSPLNEQLEQCHSRLIFLEGDIIFKEMSSRLSKVQSSFERLKTINESLKELQEKREEMTDTISTVASVVESLNILLAFAAQVGLTPGA